MADRNVTFLIIAKDFASRTMKAVGDSTDRAAQRLRNLDQFGIGPVKTAGAALGPALTPVLAGATVGAVGLGTAFVGAGAALGVFGAVTKSVFGEVQEASQKSESLREKVSLLARQQQLAAAAGDTANAGKYEKARTRALYEYRARLMELPAPIRQNVIAMDSMRTSWDAFITKSRPQSLGFLHRGMLLIADVLPKLTPLYQAGATAANEGLSAIRRWTAGGGVDRMVSFLAKNAVPTLRSFGGILISLGYGVGQLLAPFASTSGGVVAGLNRMSVSFATWARESGRAGVERILGFAQENGPGAASAFGELAGAVVTLAQAATPLAPISIAIATGLGAIIDALPQSVLTAMIGGFIAWNVAVTGARVATVLMAGGQRAMAAATWLMNSALLASPITWIVVGLVALAAGLYVAYQRSATFRSIVQGALRGAVAAGQAVLGFFRGVPGFFSGMWGQVTAAFTAATGWIGRSLTALGGWFTALPGRIMAGIAALPGLWWGFWMALLNRAAFLVGYGIGLILRIIIRTPGLVLAGLRALPGIVWGVVTSAWNGARARTTAGVNAVVSFARALPGRARSAVSGLWGAMAGAFSSAWSGARSYASRAVSDAVGFFRTLPGKARSAVSGLPGQIKSVFSGASGWLLSAGRDLILGFVQGIGNMAGAAVQKAKEIAGSVVSGVKSGLGIGSPSRVMADEVGRWIPPGITAGMQAAAPGMLGSMAGLMARLAEEAGRPVTAGAMLGSASWSTAGAGPGGGAAAGGGFEILQPVQLVVDGKVLHQVLLKVKRDRGGIELGLA